MRNSAGIVLFAVAVVAFAGYNGTAAHGFPAFKKEFDNKYVKMEPATDAERSLKDAAKKANCAICHINPDKDKKERNQYGKAISKFIPDVIGKPAPTEDDKKALAKKPQQVQELLDKAAKESSDPAKPGAPTFGDLIKEGKLPGG